MIFGMIITSLIAYFMNSYYSGNLINYPSREQVADILPSFFVAFLMGIIVFSLGLLLPFKPALVLLVQLLTGATLIPLIAGIFKLDAYIEAKEIIRENLGKKSNNIIQNGNKEE